MTPLIDPKHLATLREMSDAYQRGQVPQWKRDRAIALEQAVAAIERGEKAQAEFDRLVHVYADKLAAERREFRELCVLINNERRMYAERLDEARRQGWKDALVLAALPPADVLPASLPENTPQEVANDQP